MPLKSRVARYLVGTGISAAAALSGGYLIVPWEGANKNKQGQHVAYVDVTGTPTACYGQTGYDLYGRLIRKGMIYSEEECLIMLSKHIKRVDNYLQRVVKVPYSSPYQEAMLISFTYNTGEGNLASSTLLKDLNAGRHEKACDELLKWVYSKKKFLQGLLNRRTEERQWCLGQVPYEAEVTYMEIAKMVASTYEDKSK